jgi:hypothetical protein
MSVESLWSVVQIAAGLALAVALGFGPAFWLLPREWRRFALAAAPAAGYALFSLATIVISASLHLPVNAAVWIAGALLLGVSAGAVAAGRRNGGLHESWSEARPAAIASIVMLVAMFWPVIYQGTSLYLGTANIDFYQSLAYQEMLVRHGLAALDPRPALDYSFEPFLGTFPDPIPAKFGGVMYGILLQKVLALDPRTALMTAVVVFVLAVPAATYFFARTALAMDSRTAGGSALLAAVSAPVAMSFMHVLVGQNSALALLPLGLAACYIAVRTRDWRAMILAFLVLDAVFWMYVAILPYIAAPVGLYALYDLNRNRGGALRWLAVACAVLVAGFVLLQAGMSVETRQLVEDMRALFGRANRTVYVDFLTEIALPHSLGLASYPVTSSVLLARVPASSYLAWAGVFVAAAFAVLALYFRTVAAWWRRSAPEPRVFAAAMLGTYLAVWLYFNFISQYGYAVFKMASWLQFLFVPFVAYALLRFQRERSGPGPLAAADRLAAAVLGGFVVLANVVATFDFGAKGLGHDTRRGAIVNSYGIGGNADFPRLQNELAGAVPGGSVVAISMPDYIANLWSAYYVERAGMKAALVSHDDFPDEDAVLPDVDTGLVTNSAGNVGLYKPRYYAERPDYLLLAGPANLNREIADQKPALEPVWSNGTFTLVKTGQAHDLLVTRRGFYRLEYFDPARYAWWWPDRMRWSAQGGEFLLINASRPGESHRLSFVAVAGKQRERTRHLEIFLNGRKFDEVEVHGAARIVTKPFLPTGAVDRIVVKARERVGVEPRGFGLWNRHIAIDQRFLNLVVAQARVERDEAPPALPVPAELAPRDLIDRSRRFNGISLDGWVAPDATIELALQRPARRIALRITVPGWAGFRFPFVVRMRVNGQSVESTLPAPGDHTIEADVPEAPRLAVQMAVPQSTQVPGGGISSFVLKSIRVE